MNIDLAPLLQGMGALAATAVTAAAPIALQAFRGWLRMRLSATQADMIANACARGAGLAYQHLVTNGSGLHQVDVANVAVAKGANYVLAGFPEWTKALGLTPERVHTMVTAELGKLLAADPTATITAPVPAGDASAPA